MTLYHPLVHRTTFATSRIILVRLGDLKLNTTTKIKMVHNYHIILGENMVERGLKGYLS